MKRLITGVLASAAWLILLLLGPLPLFWLAITALAGVALAEYLAIVLPDLSRRARMPLIFFGLLPLLGVYSGEAAGLLFGLSLALVALLLHTVSRYASLAHPYEVISRGGFGYFYLSLCSAHLILLMALPQGRAWLLLLTAITVASDTAAFYIGSKFGRHKLCLAISPGKTWEGFVGGLLAALARPCLSGIFFCPGKVCSGCASSSFSWAVSARSEIFPNRSSSGPSASRIPATSCRGTADCWTASTPCSSPRRCFIICCILEQDCV